MDHFMQERKRMKSSKRTGKSTGNDNPRARRRAISAKKTPGQEFTDQWGVGQGLPLKKDFSRLLQLGLVGYDQWQVSSNGGTVIVAGIPVRASLSPDYSLHGIGVQA